MSRELPDLTQTPGATRVVKRPLPMNVLFADGPGVCATREGRVSFQAGDALARGTAGECWPIDRTKFERTYRPIESNSIGQPGEYAKRAMTVWAIQLTEPIAVPVGWQSDPIQGVAGDWLLQYGPGDYGIVGNEIFAETYELVDSIEPDRRD